MSNESGAGIRMEQPHYFWFADSTDVTWVTDPADGRHPHSTVRWDTVADMMSRTVDAMQRTRWGEGRDGDVLLDVPAFPGVLTGTEQMFVEAFTWACPIDVDPWDDVLDDGRHRTWELWSRFPDLVLPLRSRLLHDEGILDDPVYTSEKLRESLRAIHLDEVDVHIDAIPPAVARRSPRYISALRALRN